MIPVSAAVRVRNGTEWRTTNGAVRCRRAICVPLRQMISARGSGVSARPKVTLRKSVSRKSPTGIISTHLVARTENATSDSKKKLSEIENFFGEQVGGAGQRLVDLSCEPLRKMAALSAAIMYVRNPRTFEMSQSIHQQFVGAFSGPLSLPQSIDVAGQERELDPSDWPAFRDASPDDMRRAWIDFIQASVGDAPGYDRGRRANFHHQRPSGDTRASISAIQGHRRPRYLDPLSGQPDAYAVFWPSVGVDPRQILFGSWPRREPKPFDLAGLK